MSIEGLIFDFDGTLADTMPLHWRVWRGIAERHGFRFTQEEFYALGGVPSREIVRQLAREQSLELDALEVAREKEEGYLERLGEIRPIEPIVAIVRRHFGKLPMAVASGGSRRVIERVLVRLQLRDFFDTVVTNEDVQRHKPAPDTFLEAARRLNVLPARCQAYEDTDIGLESIRAAGMQAVDVREFLRLHAEGGSQVPAPFLLELMNASSIRDPNRHRPAMPRRRFLGLAGAAGALAAHPSASLASNQRMPEADRPYRFQFALNTGTIRGQKLRLPEQIDVIAQAGYDGIEPWTGDLGEYVQSGGSLADLRKRCEDRGLKVVSAIGFAAWVVDDDAQRAKGLEQLKREMDQLSQVGGTHIAAPPAGANRPGVKIDLDRAAERYRAILELGRSLGVIPQVEVWGSSANLSQVAEALYVAARSGHPDACVLADAFHMYKAGTEPAALRLLGRQAVHCFHMNDYPAAPPREAIRDAERVWPGDGVAPLAQILRILADNHCRVFLSLELFNPEYWKLPAIEAAKTGLAKMKAAVESAGLLLNARSGDRAYTVAGAGDAGRVPSCGA